MKKNKLIAFISSIFFSYTSYADSHLESSPFTSINDTSLQLKSIPALQSLKDLNSKVEYQTPFVRDLKNRHNIRTLFVESHDLPIVDIQLTFNAGSARDEEIEKGLYGLSNMAAQLMQEGTEQYTAQQIASTFEATGAQFDIEAYRDMFIVRLRVLSTPTKLTPALNMMLEVLNNASFKNQSLNLTLDNMQVGQKQLTENPNRLLTTQFSRSIYGNHPYAEPITGTLGSLKKINTDWLKKFSNQFIVTQNMNIAITGNLTSKEATKLSNTISNQLKQGTKAQPLPQPLAVNGFNINHIPYNSTQAYVSIGHMTTTRDHPDRLALEVANRILGSSGFNSLLMKELRIKRGYTYAVNSNISFSQAPGTFSIGYSTRQDQLMDSLQVAHKVLVDFTQQPLDPQILEETKMGLLRAFPMNYNSNAIINAQLGSIGFYGESTNYLNQYSKRLLKLTAQDIQNAVKKHIHPSKLNLIIVSKELDQAKLTQILHHNLLPSTKIKLPTIEEIPTINSPPQTSEEVVSPSSAQSAMPSLI